MEHSEVNSEIHVQKRMKVLKKTFKEVELRWHQKFLKNEVTFQNQNSFEMWESKRIRSEIS